MTRSESVMDNTVNVLRDKIQDMKMSKVRTYEKAEKATGTEKARLMILGDAFSVAGDVFVAALNSLKDMK
jgi:hypothetical protein